MANGLGVARWTTGVVRTRAAQAKRMDCLPCVPISTDAPPADVHEQGFLQKVFARYYAPALLQKYVRPAVVRQRTSV